MIFDAFDAMSEAAFLWWAAQVALALAAFCAVVMAARWVVRKAAMRRQGRRRVQRRVDEQIERVSRHFRELERRRERW